MYLSGAAYPASKADLLRYAEITHAARILPAMTRLPERDYASALDVVKAVVGPGLPKGAARSAGDYAA